MSNTTANNGKIVELDIFRPSRSLGQEAWSRLVRNRAAVVGMFIIAFFVILAIFASVIAPQNPLKINDGKRYLPPPFYTSGSTNTKPEAAFLLGTDALGRDVLSRVIYGARVSMVVGFIPTTIILVLGTIIGMAAGYVGGQWDNILMRVTDVVYAFPDLLFFIIVMVALRDSFIGQLMNGLILLFAALAIVNWVGVARLVRGQVLSIKEKEYIEAARCIGVKDVRIMSRHILPNSLGPLIVSAAFNIPGLIITEAILGYLGIGLRPATDPASFFITSWGTLMLDGQSAVNSQPFLLLSPAICVALIVLAFTFLGDGLRDALDPRMRGTQ
jgi:ABC-type dipeptide/oligopeptide/nickel transport system permease subunit